MQLKKKINKKKTCIAQSVLSSTLLISSKPLNVVEHSLVLINL